MDERLKRDLVDRPASVATRLELVDHLVKLEKRIEAGETLTRQPTRQRFNIDLNNGETVFIQRRPEVVRAGEHNVLGDAFVFPRDGLTTLVSIWIFHGLDSGNLAEMDTAIYDGVYPLALRSPHKETLVEFDAWKHYRVDRKLGHDPLIVVGCRAASPKSVRPHWGIYLLWRVFSP